jgi:hypothetical protein
MVAYFNASPLQQAEEAIYQDNCDPMVNWDGLDLQKDLEKVGLAVKVEQERSRRERFAVAHINVNHLYVSRALVC